MTIYVALSICTLKGHDRNRRRNRYHVNLYFVYCHTGASSVRHLRSYSCQRSRAIFCDFSASRHRFAAILERGRSLELRGPYPCAVRDQYGRGGEVARSRSRVYEWFLTSRSGSLPKRHPRALPHPRCLHVRKPNSTNRHRTTSSMCSMVISRGVTVV